MTLPCNASMSTYPENRPGKFTTCLAREVVLDGEWEVGLAEFMIPSPKHQLNFTEPIMYAKHVDSSSEIKVFHIMSSQLNTLTDVWKLTDTFPKEDNGFKKFYLSVRDEKVTLFILNEYSVYWDEDNKNLAMLLGFPPFGVMSGRTPGYTEYIAPMKFAPGKPFLAFVYCDLVEYNYIGDSMSPCLRTLSVSPAGMDNTTLRVENPHYVPVAFNRFSQVSIEIASDLGTEVKFTKGLSLVKLHFRPKKR